MSRSPILNIEPLSFPWQTRDPFLFCAYHLDSFPKGNAELGPDASLQGRHIGQDFASKDGWNMYHGTQVPGFPAHPHRGFETVTVVGQGYMDHSDSYGASGRYGDGDVQWMTAGKGLQHCEMMPLLKRYEANPLEVLQIWLNLPPDNKMAEPEFKMLWAEDIPVAQVMDAHGKQTEVKVFAGSYNDLAPPKPPVNSWAHDADNHVAVWSIKLEPGATWELPESQPGANRTLYFYRGDELSIGGAAVTVANVVDLDPAQSVTLSAGSEPAEIFMLQGKPIGAQVVQHGAFVMNSEKEIHEAFADYRRTEFGGWPWPQRDNTHGPTQGRFAEYADGRREEKTGLIESQEAAE